MEDCNEVKRKKDKFLNQWTLPKILKLIYFLGNFDLSKMNLT